MYELYKDEQAKLLLGKESFNKFCLEFKMYLLRGVAQSGLGHQNGVLGVPGSNPGAPTIKERDLEFGFRGSGKTKEKEKEKRIRTLVHTEARFFPD